MTTEEKCTLSRPECLALAAILILAFVLRIVGIRWGLPNALHSYSYHPDEFLTIGAAAGVAGLLGQPRTLNPHLYNYPSLYLYLAALSMMVAGGYGWLGGAQGVYLAARIVTVLMAVGAVAATYWAGRLMFGKTAGLLAAFILAIVPLHVQHSHFATVDVPSTLWVALCLGYAALIVKRGDWRDYILAGAMAGLAGGTKYNAVLILLAPMAAHILRAPFNAKSILDRKLWLMPLCAIAAFVLTTPGSVLYTQEFIHGLTYEMQHASTGHGLVFAGTGNGFLYTVNNSLWYGLTPLPAMLMLGGVIGALWKRDKAHIILLAFAVPYLVMISVSQVRFARYALPLFPVIAILIGWFVARCLSVPSKRRWEMPLVFGAYLGLAGFVCVLMIGPFVKPDPRDEAARWIRTHISQGSTIGLIDYPWFYTPPLEKDWTLDVLPRRMAAVTKTPYAITVFSTGDRPGWWWNAVDAPRWVITTDYETADAIRLRGNTQISAQDRARVKAILADLDLINKHYTVRKRFANTMGLGPIEGFHSDQFPHDMRYVAPTITIYERKD